jgi:ketosteroid isomerase-like protein
MQSNGSEVESDIRAIIETNQRFYDAFGALDLDTMETVWENSERALCVHPGWAPLLDWELIRESWERIFDNATLMHFNVRYINAAVQGDCGWVTCVENITSVLQGRASDYSVLATNIFVRSPVGWRVTAHHASPSV